jgi:hypothetical protein
MPDISQTLIALDDLLQVFDLRDFDTTLLGLEPSKRAAVKREKELAHVMELVSVELLRKKHIGGLIEQVSNGCSEYLYALVRVHAGHEILYHELLSDLCEGRHPSLYHGDKIRPYWETWWAKNGRNPSFSTLDWKANSKNLDAALEALTTTDSRTAARLLDHPHSLVRQSIARRPDLDEECQYQLADDPEPMVRIELALNSCTSAQVLTELGNDLNSIVRRWVACHPSTPQHVLARLKADPVDQVRAFLDKPRT